MEQELHKILKRRISKRRYNNSKVLSKILANVRFNSLKRNTLLIRKMIRNRIIRKLLSGIWERLEMRVSFTKRLNPFTRREKQLPRERILPPLLNHHQLRRGESCLRRKSFIKSWRDSLSVSLMTRSLRIGRLRCRLSRLLSSFTSIVSQGVRCLWMRNSYTYDEQAPPPPDIRGLLLKIKYWRYKKKNPLKINLTPYILWRDL